MAGVRLQDVAELAGVSMKTVSNVVRDYPHVSERMRSRVEAAIAELGYRPNISARRLATGRTGMLSLAFSDVSLPYFAELARIVTGLASERGYRLLLEQTDGTAENEREIISTRESGLVDGILFQPSRMPPLEISKQEHDAPLVLLGEGPAPLSIDHVMIDNAAAVARATGHLVALGCRRIGFVGHEAINPSATSIQRLSGFRNAISAAALELDEALVLPTPEISPRDSADAVRRALEAGHRFDGLVCRDDLAAIGALRAVQEFGLRVPDDVAVIGWDDITMASFTHPSLTTIAPDTTQIATLALDMLEERIGGYAGPGRHRVADFTLMVRESAPSAGSLHRS
jgi:DNA-binding LacI/PurR family transcriptional regulator